LNYARVNEHSANGNAKLEKNLLRNKCDPNKSRVALLTL